MAVYLIASGSYVGFQLHISIKLHSNCNFKNFNSALDAAIEFSAFLSGNEREVLIKLSVGAEN